jgi:hypothetical protein
VFVRSCGIAGTSSRRAASGEIITLGDIAFVHSRR